MERAMKVTIEISDKVLLALIKLLTLLLGRS